MAKSNGFWGKRRGSAGSLTFSVLNGKQVTKEKVTSVRNPKTQYQARQRMITSLATKMAANLRGIVDHSFQNIAYGEKSVQHFLSMAMKPGEGNYFLSIPKGATGFQPMRAVVSEGSLKSNGFLCSIGEPELIKTDNWATNATDYANFLATNKQFKDGDQITVLVVINDKIHAEETIVGFSDKDNSVLIDRIVLNDANCANIESVETENGSFEISLKNATISCNEVEGEKIIVGCVVITSRMNVASGKWERSTETMAIGGGYNSMLLLQQYQADLATFMPAAASMNSDRYLNQAERAADASTIYTEAVAVVEVGNLQEGAQCVLGVKDSEGVYHIVDDGTNVYNGEIHASGGTLEAPPISQFQAIDSVLDEATDLVANQLSWDNFVGTHAAQSITWGSRVHFVDIADFLFAQ